MSAIEKRMSDWKSDWKFMEQSEKDLYLAVEKELAEKDAELAALRQERDEWKQRAEQAAYIKADDKVGFDWAVLEVVEAARKEHSLLNSVMNWMTSEGIQIPFTLSVLIGSLKEADIELAAALARVDGKGEK